MRSDQIGKKNMIIPRAACILALAMMGICGFAYKTAANHLKKSVIPPIVLPLPLKSFPMTVGGWSGKDVPWNETVVQATGNDDFCNRFYVISDTDRWVNFYIGYSGHPRTMLGHRPDLCYVGAGWIHGSTVRSDFISRSGLRIPCLIHRFYTPEPKREELVVLNFYVVNGKPFNDENVFSGVAWRTPNINGNMARYVAQIQINSVIESAALAFAGDSADIILSFLPDERGKVRAAQDGGISGDTIK
jgi:hypothetical protein